MGSEVRKQKNSLKNQLEFTGNWFIDLGILGFVNLMEEVYGWDLEELKEKILSDKAIVFYSLFPIAYFKNWLLVRGHKNSEVRIVYEEIKAKLKRFDTEQQIFDEAWWGYIVPMFREIWVKTVIEKLLEEKQAFEKWKNFLEPSYFTSVSKFVKNLENLINKYRNDTNFKNLLGKRKEVKALKIEDLRKLENCHNLGTYGDSLDKDLSTFFENLHQLKKSLKRHWENLPKKAVEVDDKSRILFRLPIDHSFFKNFMFFNQNKNIWEQKELMYKLVTFDMDEIPLQKIDKAVNKLFPSDKEFPNETYTKFSTSNFKDIDKLFVFLLCFPEAFNRFGGVNIAFYSNSLEFSHKVNKRIKIVLNRENARDILNFTWRQIIDTLWEYKSNWALENMYLIQYKRLDNQAQQEVEYLGISKLQAEFIVDDKIREALNQKIKVLEKGDKQYQWLLQEFIKNKPLLPISYRNLGLYFSQKDSNSKQKRRFKNTEPLIYSAALDKVIAELSIKKTNLFSDDFFFRNKPVLDKAKDTIRGYFYLKSVTEELFSQDSPDERKTLAYQLFSRLRKNQKYSFVNEILKALNGKNADGVKTLINYIFRNILSNDKTWQSDAVPILIGLIGGGSDE